MNPIVGFFFRYISLILFDFNLTNHFFSSTLSTLSIGIPNPPISNKIHFPSTSKSQLIDQRRIADKINNEFNENNNNVLPKPELVKTQSKNDDDWTPIAFHAGEDTDPEIRHRRDTIREMMQHAWKNYVRYAWGENELNPISRTGHSAGIFGNSKLGNL